MIMSNRLFNIKELSRDSTRILLVSSTVFNSNADLLLFNGYKSLGGFFPPLFHSQNVLSGIGVVGDLIHQVTDKVDTHPSSFFVFDPLFQIRLLVTIEIKAAALSVMVMVREFG